MKAEKSRESAHEAAYVHRRIISPTLINLWICDERIWERS